MDIVIYYIIYYITLYTYVTIDRYIGRNIKI